MAIEKPPKTSAITSVNQVAAGIKRAIETGILKEGMRALDWGGGRFNTGIQFLASHGIEARVYDKYARSDEENQRAIVWALVKPILPDVVFLNNVLCVIPTLEERQDTVRAAWKFVKKDGFLIVTNYEGDKSGVVKGFQNNRESCFYLDEIRSALDGDFIQLRKGKVYFYKKL